MAAVGRSDDIDRAQRPTGTHRRRLLPDREVDEARDLPVAIEIGHPLLEAAYQQHPAVHFDEVSRREGGQRGRAGAHVLCTVLVGRYNGRRAMIDRIDIPGRSFSAPMTSDGDRVIAITGAGGALVALCAATRR